MAFVRRYTQGATDSLACVTISGGATFKNLPNGKYIDAVTGDVKYVTDGTLTVSSVGKANMRVYVCCADGFTGIDGRSALTAHISSNKIMLFFTEQVFPAPYFSALNPQMTDCRFISVKIILHL